MKTTCAVLTAILLAPPALASEVHVVDDNGGPGVDFTDLQAAVTAAADRDVLLVKAGGYAPFTISGKGLTVIADNDQPVGVAGQITVENLPADRTVVLRGIETTSPSGFGLLVDNCAGAVRIEECKLEGQKTPLTYEAVMLFQGAVILDSDNVAIARSFLTGGDGSNVGYFGQPHSGASGILAQSSTLSVFDSELVGGTGASCPDGESYGGAFGGHGISIWNTALWVSGCKAWGGNGGSGDEDFDIFIGQICGDGGDGGSGISITSWGPPGNPPQPSTASVRDFTVQPGFGGGTICGAPGANGLPVLADTSTPHVVDLFAGPGRSTYASSPVRGGGTLRIYAEGLPGDTFFLLLGGQPISPLNLPASPLPLSVAPPFTVLTLGTVPGTGTLITPLPLGLLPAGFGGATAPIQGALIDTSLGAVFELAPYGTVTLLEQVY